MYMNYESESHSVNLRDVVYNEGIPEFNDPAEAYFEASKLTTEGLAWETPGIAPLYASEELQRVSERASRRYVSRSFSPFSSVSSLTGSLSDALHNRRSSQTFSGGEIALADLACVLEESYGSRHVKGFGERRNSPSGGALYPLDLYVVTRNIESIPSGTLKHFDPYRHGLSDLGSVPDISVIEKASLIPDVAEQASAFILVSCMFWRSRFKYSQRALRFSLMESGHVAQNILLTATGLGIKSRLFGGFIDDKVNSALPDHNGVDDSVLYLVMLGT